MVWAAIRYSRHVTLIFLNGRQIDQVYIQTLEDNLLPFIELLAGLHSVFQQDNA